MLTLRRAMPREAPARQPLCADIDGLSLHAAVRAEVHERKATRGACWSLCSVWSHGRPRGALWAPVPRPRLHLVRFHGVLAPDAKLRSLVGATGAARH